MKTIIKYVTISVLIIGLLFLITRINCSNIEPTPKKIVKDEGVKVELINELINKVDELTVENATYQAEAEEILKRKNYYKKKYQDFQQLKPTIETIFLNSDTVEITREIHKKVNTELIAQIQQLKNVIEQMKTKEVSNLAAISHELTEKAVFDAFKPKSTVYKYSLLVGWGLNSYLSDFNPLQQYNVGFTSRINKRLDMGLIGSYRIDENIGLSFLLYYNF